jgi:radical SAM superfamily enzyme YgiQ (UPF0313 family)
VRNIKVLLLAINVHNSYHYYSLALGFLKAYALKDKVVSKYADIEIMDFCVRCNDVEQILFYIAESVPDVIGLSCYCWNAGQISDLARLAKQVIPRLKVVVGGPEVGPAADQYLQENKAIDVIVRGEGEATFSEVLKHYITGQPPLAKIPGISYRENGQVVHNVDRALIENLDDIPSPYLTGVLRPRDKVTYIETYRGCVYKCAYCFEGKNYEKLRFFSLERVEQEIRCILDNPYVNSFSFIDPVFNLKKERFDDILSLIAKLNSHRKQLHTIEIMTELLSEKSVAGLKKAGVVSIETGPQSAHPETIKNVKRFFDRSKFVGGIKLLKKEKIKILCDLILGLPGDNFFRFSKSIKFVMALQPETIIFSTLHVLPGSYLFENADEFKLRFDQKAPHYVLSNYSFPYEELIKAQVMAKSVGKEYNLS